jgi:hypothetical protein
MNEKKGICSITPVPNGIFSDVAGCLWHPVILENAMAVSFWIHRDALFGCRQFPICLGCYWRAGGGGNLRYAATLRNVIGEPQLPRLDVYSVVCAFVPRLITISSTCVGWLADSILGATFAL